MTHGLRRMAYVMIAFVIAQVVVGLAWSLVNAAGWSATGVSAVALLIGSYVLAGLAGAVAYTYLNDGGDALRALMHRRPRSRHHRSA